MRARGDGANFSDWREDMAALAERIMRNFERVHGFPPDENVLVCAADAEGGGEVRRELSSLPIAADLIDFYNRVDSVSFPDAENGYFIHAPEDVIDGVRSSQPTKLAGAVEDEVTVLGSDGGGALFAINVEGDKVYRLEGGGVIGSVYEADESSVDLIANGLWGFLCYFREQVARSLPEDWN